MLIDIKMNTISGIRSQWPFEPLRRPWHLSPFLQNGGGGGGGGVVGWCDGVG